MQWGRASIARAVSPVDLDLHDIGVRITEPHEGPSNAVWLQYLHTPACAVSFDERDDHVSIVVSSDQASATVFLDLRTRERVIQRDGDPRRRRQLSSFALAIATRKDHFDLALDKLRDKPVPTPVDEDGPWSRMQLLAGASGGWWLPPSDLSGVGEHETALSATLRVNRLLRSAARRRR